MTKTSETSENLQFGDARVSETSDVSIRHGGIGGRVRRINNSKTFGAPLWLAAMAPTAGDADAARIRWLDAQRSSSKHALNAAIAADRFEAAAALLERLAAIDAEIAELRPRIQT